MSTRPIISSVLILGLASACGPSDRDLDWEVVFAGGADPLRAARIETRIFDGGCDTSTEAYFASIVRSTPVGAQPETLPPGVYGFDAVALDDECVAYAAGCEELMLPVSDGAAVTTTLRALPSVTRRCPADRCMLGVCEETPRDGGVDADATVPDAARDVGVDATPCTVTDLVPQSECPDGYHCAVVTTRTAGNVFACFEDGPGMQADSCDGNADCARGFGCFEPGEVSMSPLFCAEYCLADSDCTMGARSACDLVDGIGFCTTHCDYSATGVCPTGMKCNVLDNDGHTYCGVTGAGGDGDTCVFDSDCGVGFGCYDIAPGMWACLQYCDPSAPDCPGALSCFRIDSFHGVCD